MRRSWLRASGKSAPANDAQGDNGNGDRHKSKSRDLLTSPFQKAIGGGHQQNQAVMIMSSVFMCPPDKPIDKFNFAVKPPGNLTQPH